MGMTEDTGRLHVLVERVVAVKEQLDELDDDPRVVRPRPPASFELLVQAHRLFDTRALPMPRDYERVLRAHDGIDNIWRSPAGGSMSLFGHRELLAQRTAADNAVISAVVVAASDDGEQAALVPGPTDLPVLIMRNAHARVVGRFPSVTAWLDWIAGDTTAEVERWRMRRKSESRAPQMSR
jgi:hypothetical protein